jgi:hypothetical protein
MVRRILESLLLVVTLLLTTSCGDGAPAAPTGVATATTRPAEPPATARSSVPTQNPSRVPVELESFPVPAGFTLDSNSAYRRFGSNVLIAAGASWSGEMSVGDLVAFLRLYLANDFVLGDSQVESDAAYLSFTNAVDSSLFLYVGISSQGDVTVLKAELYRG